MSSNGDTIFTALNVIVTAIAVIVAGIAIKVQQYYAKKQSDREAMIDVFKMLNNSDHKFAEESLITSFRGNSLYIDGLLNEPFREFANTVSRNYDQIGLLVKRRLIPKNDILYMFGKLVVVYHLILFLDIQRRRHLGESDFMVNFTHLAIDSYNYWKQKGRDRLPREPQNNTEITDVAIRLWNESLPDE